LVHYFWIGFGWANSLRGIVEVSLGGYIPMSSYLPIGQSMVNHVV
jgi:hypothetical protein